MRLPAFEYHAPTSLDEVFALLAEHGASAKLMAGGTDLLPGLKIGKRSAGHVIALKGVRELAGLSFDEREGLTIGARTRLFEVGESEAVAERYPALNEAIRTLATVQVRNKATVAGNLCNASPCADTATPLCAYGATAVLRGPDGVREVPLEEFFVGPSRTAIGEREVMERLVVPPPPADLRSHFIKFSSRSRVDIAAVNLTLALRLEKGVIASASLFLGTVAPTPMRAVEAEKCLVGERVTPELFERAAAKAREECKPITDFRATAEYKRRIVYVMTRRAIQALTTEEASA